MRSALLVLLLLPAPAAALDALYLVRHAEKVDDWPPAPELWTPSVPSTR